MQGFGFVTYGSGFRASGSKFEASSRPNLQVPHQHLSLSHNTLHSYCEMRAAPMKKSVGLQRVRVEYAGFDPESLPLIVTYSPENVYSP